MSLDEVLAEHFAAVSTTELIGRINRAAEFKYDDEAYELNRRLGAQGLSWKWSRATGREVVEVFDPQTGLPAAYR
ncbi:MAG: hypothetical protein PHQ28_00580 [Mycobacterium sp.]|nr:hypothetical protein [Mycobacterium sp.]